MWFSMLWGLAFAGDRVELPVARKDEAQVVSAGAHGLVVYVSRVGEKKSYEIHGYDADFNETFTTDHDLGRRLEDTAYHHDADHAWVLLQRERKRVDVLRTDLRTGESVQIEVPLDRKINDRGLIQADGSGGAWVAVNGRRHGSLSWVSPTGDAQVVALPRKMRVQDLVGGGELAQLALLPSTRTPEALVLLDLADGQIVRERRVTAADGESLMSGKTFVLDGRDWVIGANRPANAIFPGAQGLYVARFDGDAQALYTTHDFGDFEGFWDWLPDRKEARVEKRAQKKRDRDQTPRIRVNLLFSDAIATDSGPVVVAESYYSVYHTYQTTSTNAQGQTVVTTHQVFLGYRFTHATIVGFDGEGQRLWDHSVPLDSRLSRTITSHVRLLADGPELSLIYPYQKHLHTTRIRDGEKVEDGRELEMAEVGGDDAVKNLYGDALWWYDDAFLVWGADKVRDDDDKTSRAFWFSRLQATPIDAELGAPAEP